MTFPPSRVKLQYFLRTIKKLSPRKSKEMLEAIEALLMYSAEDPDDMSGKDEEAWELWLEFKEIENKARQRRGIRISLTQMSKDYDVPPYLLRRALEAFAKSKGKTLADYLGTRGGRFVYVIPRTQYDEFMKFIMQYVEKEHRRAKTYAEYLREQQMKQMQNRGDVHAKGKAIGTE